MTPTCRRWVLNSLPITATPSKCWHSEAALETSSGNSAWSVAGRNRWRWSPDEGQCCVSRDPLKETSLWVGSDGVGAGCVDLEFLAGGAFPNVDTQLGLTKVPVAVGFDAVCFAGQGSEVVWAGLAGFTWDVWDGVVQVEVSGWC